MTGTESRLRLRITPMVLEDLPAVMRIERDSNIEPWTEDSFLEELERPRSMILVARTIDRQEGEPGAATAEPVPEVVGYICFWCVADEVQILNVAVHPGYRRRGVGRLLLHECLQYGRSKKAGFAVLEVRRSNVSAQMLYEKAGFRKVGERPDYYGVVKEAALLMELEMIDEQWD